MSAPILDSIGRYGALGILVEYRVIGVEAEAVEGCPAEETKA